MPNFLDKIFKILLSKPIVHEATWASMSGYILGVPSNNENKNNTWTYWRMVTFCFFKKYSVHDWNLLTWVWRLMPISGFPCSPGVLPLATMSTLLSPTLEVLMARKSLKSAPWKQSYLVDIMPSRCLITYSIWGLYVIFPQLLQIWAEKGKKRAELL